MRSRARRWTLVKGIKGSFIRDWGWRRGCGDHIHNTVGGRLPNLVSFGCKLPRVYDILSHQVGADVWGQVVKEEAPEHEVLHLVNSVIQRKQATHLAHQGGRLLIRCHGEGHKSLVSLERVQGVKLGEAFLEGLIGIFLGRELDEIHDLGCISTVESAHAVVKLCNNGSYPLDDWASVWANQTLALSAQTSGSLMATALRSKVSIEADVGGSDTVEEINKAEKERHRRSGD